MLQMVHVVLQGALSGRNEVYRRIVIGYSLSAGSRRGGRDMEIAQRDGMEMAQAAIL